MKLDDKKESDSSTFSDKSTKSCTYSVQELKEEIKEINCDKEF